MHIKSFYIEQFGILQDLKLDDLSDGLNVFIGNNEAGKSSCLEFFRTVLSGYPNKNSAEYKEKASLFNSRLGTVKLITKQGIFSLTRRNGNNNLILEDNGGNKLDATVFEQLISGMTREVYRNVYGFSLSELQSFESLKKQDVRHALYGASFGMGLKSPGQAIASIENSMSKLYKPQGSNQIIPKLLKELSELREQINLAEHNLIDYDELVSQIKELEEANNSLRAKQKELNLELNVVERKLVNWQPWDDWQRACQELLQLEYVSPNFPKNGVERLQVAFDQFEQAKRSKKIAEQKLLKMNHELGQLDINYVLLEKSNVLRGLAERKSSFKNAFVQIPLLNTSIEQTKENLQTHLEILGTDFTVEKVKGIDRSLFMRKGLDDKAEQISQYQNAYDTSVQYIDKIALEIVSAKHNLELAEKELANIPTPATELDDMTRDKLRRAKDKFENAKERLPERKRNLAELEAEYKRVLSFLKLNETSSSILEKLAEIQDEAIELANQITMQVQEAETAKQALLQAKESEKQIRVRMMRLQNEKVQQGLPTRNSLELKKNNLRRLRELNTESIQEKQKLNELSEEHKLFTKNIEVEQKKDIKTIFSLSSLTLGLVVFIATYVFGFMQNATSSNDFILSPWYGVGLSGTGLVSLTFSNNDKIRHFLLQPLAFLCIGGGMSVILAKRFLDLNQIITSSGHAINFEMWGGFVTMLFGIASLMLSASGKNLVSSQKNQAEQIAERLGQIRNNLTVVDSEIDALCAALEITENSVAELDQYENELELEREKVVTNERIGQEFTNVEQELEKAHEFVAECEAEFNEKNSKLNRSKMLWHDYLNSLGVVVIPSYESAQTFFMRVENGRKSLHDKHLVEQEILELENYSTELAILAKELLPEKFHPENWQEQALVLQAVYKILDLCREADLMAEERAAAKEALKARLEQLDNLYESKQKAEEEVSVAKLKLDEIELNWQEFLQSLGLERNLTPKIAREAFDCMDKVLQTDTELRRLSTELERYEQELNLFVEPLCQLLKQLGVSERVSGNDGYIHLLDDLLSKLEINRKHDETKSRLLLEISEFNDEFESAHIFENDCKARIDNLFNMAEVDNEESFRHKSDVMDKKTSLVARKSDLENLLIRYIGGDIEAVVREFSKLDKDELLRRKDDISLQLNNLLEQDKVELQALSDLRHKLERFSSSSELVELKMSESQLLEIIRQKSLEWSKFAIARHLLNEARQNFERERQPELVRIASELFANITDNAWVKINTSLEDGSLKVIPEIGEAMLPENLSRGTQEQLYLCLRLAHIISHSSIVEPLPVIMDDILVNFDLERASRTIDIIASLTAHTQNKVPNQILYFTCHEHHANLLAKVANAKVYRVEHGKIASN